MSSDRRWMAVANTDHTVTVWDAATSRKQVELRGHNGAVMALEFSPDGQRLATGSTDHIVIVWDVPNGPFEWDLSTRRDLSSRAFAVLSG